MMLCVPILLLTPLGAADIELGIALVGKTHAAVKLHSPVARVEQGFGGMRLGHAAGNFRVPVQRGIGHQGRRVVNEGAARIHRRQDIHCRVLEGLVGPDQLAELLAGFEVINNRVQAARR